MGAGSAAYMIGLEIFEAIPFQLNVEHFLAVAFGGAILGGVLRLMICGLVKNMMEQVLSRTCSIIFFCSQHPEFITQIEEYSSDERR